MRKGTFTHRAVTYNHHNNTRQSRASLRGGVCVRYADDLANSAEEKLHLLELVPTVRAGGGVGVQGREIQHTATAGELRDRHGIARARRGRSRGRQVKRVQIQLQMRQQHLVQGDRDPMVVVVVGDGLRKIIVVDRDTTADRGGVCHNTRGVRGRRQ